MTKNETFGSRLRQLRIEKKLTQSELGALLGVKKSAISKYERDTLEVNYTMSKTLADYFNVSLDYLMGTNQNAESAEELHIKRLIHEYRILINQLDITEIEAVLDIKKRGVSILEVNKSLKKLLVNKPL